jgi:hypothetical protein
MNQKSSSDLHDPNEQGILSHARQLGHIHSQRHQVPLLVNCHLLSGTPHDVGVAYSRACCKSHGQRLHRLFRGQPVNQAMNCHDKLQCALLAAAAERDCVPVLM